MRLHELLDHLLYLQPLAVRVIQFHLDALVLRVQPPGVRFALDALALRVHQILPGLICQLLLLLHLRGGRPLPPLGVGRLRLDLAHPALQRAALLLQVSGLLGGGPRRFLAAHGRLLAGEEAPLHGSQLALHHAELRLELRVLRSVPARGGGLLLELHAGVLGLGGALAAPLQELAGLAPLLPHLVLKLRQLYAELHVLPPARLQLLLELPDGRLGPLGHLLHLLGLHWA
mmetsp:Transcript_25771/g.68847  ORF Transcript_25771/g.68847 Transcript_25771/m.68847 type:complete len:230 (+) Transcript_25771:1034-1723(+)